MDLAADPLVTLLGPVVCPEAVRRRPPLAPFSLGAIVSNDSTSELSAVAEALLFVAELLDARLLCRPCVVRVIPYSTYPCDVVDGRLSGGSHKVLASRLREVLEGIRAPMVAPDGGSCLSVEVLTGRATTAAAYAALGLAEHLAKRGARGETRRSGRWTAIPDVEAAAGGVVVPHGVAAADGGDAGAAAAVPGGGGGDGGGGDGVVVRLMKGRMVRRRTLSGRRRESGQTMAFRYHAPLSLWMVWRRLITSRYGTATYAIRQWGATRRIDFRAAGFRSTPSYYTAATLRWRRGTSSPLSALSNGSSLATSFSCASTVASGLVDAGRTL